MLGSPKNGLRDTIAHNNVSNNGTDPSSFKFQPPANCNTMTYATEQSSLICSVRNVLHVVGVFLPYYVPFTVSCIKNASCYCVELTPARKNASKVVYFSCRAGC